MAKNKNKEKIEIEVGEKGEVTIDAIGFTGKMCEEATKEFEKELGKIKNRDKKPEFYKKLNRQQNQRS